MSESRPEPVPAAMPGLVTRALETLAEKELPSAPTRTMTPAEAVADIRELRKGVTLGGLRIKDLINEGRR